MKITKRQLRQIIKEEKRQLMRETIGDTVDVDSAISTAADNVSEVFQDQMGQLFGEEPEMFAGRSTAAEWTDQVDRATEELDWRIQEAILGAVEKVEMMLHDGQFHQGSGGPRGNRPR